MLPLSAWVRVLLASSAILVFTGCQHREPYPGYTYRCPTFEQAMDLSDRIRTLNQLADAFSRKCYETVITYGARAQSEFRHKTFHVFKETASVFIPDGTLTDYVLESYERGFLSVLLAASYANTRKADDAKVELRRLDHELFVPLYNFGEDPVNILLSAVLWERLGEIGEARVDWHRLRDPSSGLTSLDDSIRAFADRQVNRIDDGRSRNLTWRVYGLGRFPEIDWDLQFTGSDNGYFLIRAKSDFGSACTSDTGMRISTQSWFQKIAMRHNNAYHPLLNVQSWIRLPMGVIYSLVPVAAGAGIAVGGCTADAAMSRKGGGGALCQISIRGGMVLMSTAPKVLRGALEPDLRHWEYIPSAFVVTSAAEPAQEPCYTSAAPAIPMQNFVLME